MYNNLQADYIRELNGDNPELSWEDLLKMDLKPVWVEWIYPVMEDETGATEDETETEGYWATVIVQGDRIYLHWNSRGIHKMLYDNQTEIYKDGMGSRWMAYRKERK